MVESSHLPPSLTLITLHRLGFRLHCSSAPSPIPLAADTGNIHLCVPPQHSETFLGSLMSVEGRLLVCLGWKPGPSEGACSVSQWTSSHTSLCFAEPIPVGIVYSRLIPKRTCCVFCLPPSPLCMPPTMAFPTEAQLRCQRLGVRLVSAHILVCPVSCITRQVT